jgi:ubiquitin carboxyl-terminal hydrolase 7
LGALYDKRVRKATFNTILLICWPQIARDVDLHEQIGKDIFFDLVDHDKVRSFRIQKQTPFIIFKV